MFERFATNILICSFIAIKSSTELFMEPDLNNTLMPIIYRQLCGLNGDYRLKETLLEKCRINLIESQMIAKQVIGRTNNRILNGNVVLDRESPWTVQIARKSYDGPKQFTHYCTGVLFTMNLVLTAAHCWQHNLGISIFAGSDDTFSGWNTADIVFYQHPGYMPDKNSDYDIGIIRLKTPIEWNQTQQNSGSNSLKFNTICLPQTAKIYSPDYQNVTVFGWGQQSSNQFPYTLQKADTIARYCCGDLHFETETSGYPRMCKGDSGSGMVQYIGDTNRAVLIGIVIKVNLKGNNDICDEENMGTTEAIRVDIHMEWINTFLKNFTSVDLK